ncbi:hypothetical protein FO519_009993 [Halicephalobus sp. NKZ332]|nr:hypothetical protein FO519_009993 [Halicephalobus sp. NKZ332]
MKIFTLVLVFLTINCMEGYKLAILVPDISGSQLMFNQRVAETLADAGHNVTLIRLQIMKYGDVKAKTRKDIHEIFGDGILKDFDYDEFKNRNAQHLFEDKSIWAFLSKENRAMIANASMLFAKGCEGR